MKVNVATPQQTEDKVVANFQNNLKSQIVPRKQVKGEKFLWKFSITIFEVVDEARDDLLEQIRGGKQLKKVEPVLHQRQAVRKYTLGTAIANAMAARRVNIQEDDSNNSDDDSWLQ